ncbi:MAG TPA: hypothetical protein DCZ00_00395 [Lactococcus sp.]|uniref:Cystathionine beta-lyase n=1 Tax=Lactococcus muris TaxID=2941330 RepID=A0ABV4DE70_9LACT|nr:MULTISPECIES: hypothetical protein [Lactococcus]MBL3717152.1 hypothetical protein [Lactococcus garvieae]HBC89886.1 hypothetical protein [Lactococcus sp.]
MKNKEYIDLGLKYGGYMAQDRVFLENRLESLTDEKEKMLLVTPPSSVINAYFAELYQKRSPQDATKYFFALSRDLAMFQTQPNFHLEGKEGTENFRFVRLNISGKSFGFCYRNAQEEALVFSEFPLKMTTQIVYEIAQIFPHYVLEQENEYLVMKKADFKGRFTDVHELSDLTTADENENYIRLTGYNFEDLLLQAEKIGYLKPLLYQAEKNKCYMYISKGF